MSYQRIAKIIARAGLCSRREAERWIADGRVRVEGKVIDSPALNVGEDAHIEVDGKPLSEVQKARLWLYHKPVGLITTHSDPEGRPTVFAHLPDTLPRVISVGRLDLNSEGLLLLTNDGALARHMELPKTGIKRSYRLRIKGQVNDRDIAQLAQGIEVDGVRYGSIEVARESDNKSGANHWVCATLTEGKNRELRRVFEYLGHPVSRLIRVAYGEYALGELAVGEVYEVSPPTASLALQPSNLRSPLKGGAGGATERALASEATTSGRKTK